MVIQIPSSGQSYANITEQQAQAHGMCGEKRGKTEGVGYMPLNTRDFSQSQKPIRSRLQGFPRISNNNWTFQSDHKKLELFPFSLMLCQFTGICQCLSFVTVEVLPDFLLVRGETTLF